MRKLALSVALALGVFGALAVAGSSAHAQKGKDKDGGSKVKVYDFSGDTIEGDLVKPEGSTIDTRDFGDFTSLIRIRKEFIAEIIKAAEDL